MAKTIMTVDDALTMRKVISFTLKGAGYDVVEAQDGVAALGALRSKPVDAIISDVNMPNMDGLTFVKHFRQTNKTTPMIMVTTEAEKARVIEAIKAGVNNYVIKPFTPELLAERIRETVERFKAAA